MPQRTANMSLTVHRDGKRKIVEAGKTFNFTADEISDFLKMDPNALRKPIVETIDDDGDDNEVNTKKSGATGGKESDTEVVEPKKSGKPLTAAQKKKQAEDEAAQKLKEEHDEAGNGSDDDL